MEDDGNGASYPERGALIAQVCDVLSAARRPLPKELKNSTLDDDGWHKFYRLANRLILHPYFEHLGWEGLCNALRDAVRNYRRLPAGKRPHGKALAAELLDGMAQEPIRRTFYLGVEHLKLPHKTTVGAGCFLLLSEDVELTESFARFRDRAPEMVCELEAVGGTDELLLNRARTAAEGVLALVRQWALFALSNSKTYLDQVMFGLDGTYTWRDGSVVRQAGWWREPRPIPMDLTSARVHEALLRLSGLSADYLALPIRLRERVDICIDHLDAAARSDRWRTMIPAVFSGMEAILVPGKRGLKGGVVTVRSVAVHVALDARFPDPYGIMSGYNLRDYLVHGTPTPDVLPDRATDLAESTRTWAFRVLVDYLKLAKAIGAGSAEDVVAHLDSKACNEVCTWLEENDGSKIVREYRDSLTKSGGNSANGEVCDS